MIGNSPFSPGLPGATDVGAALLAIGLLAGSPALDAPGSPSLLAQDTDLEPAASVEGIDEYRLENGLRALLFPDPSAPSTTVNITYLVGSRHEGYGETGMAHLLEHLVFMGTPDHPEIDSEFAARGARANGTTWVDRTNYYETFPASSDNLRWALELEADRMVNSFIAAEDLESEMTVVRNEMERGENSPSRILTERVLSSAFLWHNYGSSTIGARSDVENVPIERLQAFYRKYYQPDNAVLVIAGSFDPDEALEMIREEFGSIPRPDRSGPMRIWPTYTREPVQDGQREVTLRRVGDEQHLQAAYHIPAASHPDYAPLEILARILGDTPSGRLYQALVEPGLAASVSASSWPLAEPAPFFASTTVRLGGDLEETWAEMDRVLGAVGTDAPVTEEEVARARRERLNDLEETFEETPRMALSLTEWSAMGDWRLFFLHRDRLEGVTVEDVNRVAHRYLKPSNRTVGRFIPTESPDRTEIPEAPELDSLVADYRGREAVATGEAFDPSPANVMERTTTSTLDNGFEVALLPKETRGDRVQGRLRLHFGDLESLTGRTTEGSLAASMLMRGTEELTRQELADSLEALSASLSVGGGASIATGSLEAPRENLPAVLRLLGDVLRRPAFDAGEFRVLKEQNLASIESRRSDPGARAQRALARHMNPRPEGHPEHTETLDEAISLLEATTLEQARDFHSDFYGPQAGNLVLVGDFDPEDIRPVLDEVLGDWRSPHPFERIATDAQDVPAEEIVVEIPDRANSWFMAQQNLALRDDHPDYPALRLAGYILGGSALNSRLSRRIRTDEGLSYGVAGRISAHPVDRDGSFLGYAIQAPENADRVQEIFFEEVRQVLAEGFTPDEFERARRGWIEARQLQRADDGSLAATLGSHLYFDRTMEWDAELEERVQNLSLDEVNRAFREWIDPDEITVVRAGTFSSP